MTRPRTDSGSSVDPRSVPAATTGIFYGVGRGRRTGVFTDWDTAHAQVTGFNGHRVRKFKSEASARAYVAKVRAEKTPTWYVLKNSGRDGAYESRHVAESFKSAGSVIAEKTSLSAAKRFLGKNRVRVYRVEPDSASDSQATAASAPASPAAAAAPNPTDEPASSSQEFFSVRGGTGSGVYRSLGEALAAIAAGGGEYEIFPTEAAAAQYCKPPDLPTAQQRPGTFFVVWAGKCTGVMSAADCATATRGVAVAVAEGPMTQSVASQLWAAGRKRPTASSAGAAELTSTPAASATTSSAAVASGDAEAAAAADSVASGAEIEQPSEDQWAAALASNQSRVFACWLHDGRGRIAFSWDAAAKDEPADLSVRSFASEDTLFLNFTRAERFFDTKPDKKQEKKQLTIKQQLEAARQSVAKKMQASSDKKVTSSSASASTAKKAPASASASAGQSVGDRVGMAEVVITREMTQIRRCFVDASSAIEIRATGEPDEDELEQQLPAPGASTYLSMDMAVDGNVDRKDVTMFDFYAYKTGKVNAWPLKTFDEFLSFCRLAQKTCASSNKPVGVANAAAFSELLGIAVRAHTQMSRRGTLGPGEIRFKVRAFMHLQHATNRKVLHTSG